MFGPLSEELLTAATSYRVEMLKIAQNCYLKASACDTEDNEEEWLHHYMLGKVAEKMDAPPREYLEHYKQAALFLHEDGAKYPRKITYIMSPPHLAVESLEVRMLLLTEWSMIIKGVFFCIRFSITGNFMFES